MEHSVLMFVCFDSLKKTSKESDDAWHQEFSRWEQQVHVGLFRWSGACCLVSLHHATNTEWQVATYGMVPAFSHSIMAFSHDDHSESLITTSGSTACGGNGPAFEINTWRTWYYGSKRSLREQRGCLLVSMDCSARRRRKIESVPFDSLGV